MSQLQQIAIPFPTGGVVTNTGLADQPEGTCPNARNMRLFGALDKRTRGGQRPGLVKSFDANLASAVALVSFTDGIGSDDEFVIAGDRSDEFAVGRTFVIAGSTSNDGTYTTVTAATYDSGDDETTVFVPTASWTDTSLGSATITSQPIGSTIDEVIVSEFILDQTADLAVTPVQTDDFSAADGWVDLDKLSQASPAAGRPTFWDEVEDYGLSGAVLRQDGAAVWAIADRSPDGLMAEYPHGASTQQFLVMDQAQTVLGSNYDVFVRIRGIGTSGGAIPLGFANRAALGSTPSIGGASGTPTIRGRADFTQMLFFEMASSWSSTGTTTIAIRHRDGTTSVELDSVTTPAREDVFPDDRFPADWVEFWMKVRGSVIDFYSKLSTQSEYTLIAQFTGITELAGETGVGFGTTSLIVGYSLDRFEVGTIRLGPYGRRKQIVVAFGNSQVWTGEIGSDLVLSQVTAGTSPPQAGNIQAITLFGRVYAMDGVSGHIIEGTAASGSVALDRGEKTIVSYDAACLAFDGDSELPQNIIGVTAYRGCIILYGQTTDANNWYASAVAEPLDWRFGLDPFETSAFAADSSDFGRNPDPIFAMIPWHDDLMLIGGSHSIRQLTGDPRLGGQIDVITDSIGILGFNSWAIGKGGVVYFMGTDGFYIMPFGSQPQNLSKGKLDSLLGNVSVSNVEVIVRYDPFASGVHIWLTPITPGDPGVHVFFDELAGGFHPFEYATDAHQPYAAATLYGNSSDDQTVLLGCQDGFIRQHDEAALNDDGTAIAAFIEYRPFYAGQAMQEGVIRELQAEVASGGGDLAWTLRGAQSAQELSDGVFAFGTRTGTIVETGFARPQRVSLRFGAGSLRIANVALNETFSLERMLIRYKPAGRRRRF